MSLFFTGFIFTNNRLFQYYSIYIEFWLGFKLGSIAICLNLYFEKIHLNFVRFDTSHVLPRLWDECHTGNEATVIQQVFFFFFQNIYYIIQIYLS